MSDRFPYNIIPVHACDSSVIAANEDIFNGDPQSDYVNMANSDGIIFVIVKNAGAVGTARLTVDAATDNAGTDTDNIGYRYLKVQDPGIPGDWTVVTAANADTGVVTDAEADCIYVIDVKRADMAPVSGAKYISLTATEVANAAVDGAIFAMQYGCKYKGDDPIATPNVTGD